MDQEQFIELSILIFSQSINFDINFKIASDILMLLIGRLIDVEK